MNTSYEELLRGMLERVADDTDKREGSIIFDAVAPCAYFLAQQNFKMTNFIDLVLPDTAVGEYLDRAVKSYGITRNVATAAVRKMSTSGTVNLKTRWGIQDLVYVVTDKISENVYEVTCETSGNIGNQYFGAMQPITNGINGITAVLEDILVSGTDEETDDSLRERFYTKVRLPATSGNAYHYKLWALEVPGTGAAKVFPLADGPGTVTVLVVDSNKNVSSDLPNKVAEYIETVRPIGATVTIKSPDALTMNITANVMLDKSRSLSDVQKDFEAAVDVFLKETIFTTYRVSHAKLGSLLLDVPGVEDFEALLLNGSAKNVKVGERQIPVQGSIKLSEVSVLGIDEVAT